MDWFDLMELFIKIFIAKRDVDFHYFSNPGIQLIIKVV